MSGNHFPRTESKVQIPEITIGMPRIGASKLFNKLYLPTQNALFVSTINKEYRKKEGIFNRAEMRVGMYLFYGMKVTQQKFITAIRKYKEGTG